MKELLYSPVMTTIIPIAAILIFTIAEAFADAFQLRNLRNRSNGRVYEFIFMEIREYMTDVRRWHSWQAIRQGTFIVFATWAAGHWAVAFLTASFSGSTIPNASSRSQKSRS